MNERVRELAGPRGPRPVARVGPFVATLMNGVFGDPLVHLRIPFRRRSLLIDLGEGVKIPARTVHQVTDVFLSHTHIDHIAGFLSFLRSRIGERPLCRIFGPPGTSRNIAGLVAGVHWDRAGPRAPRFEIVELHGDSLRRFSVVAGREGPEPIGEDDAADGLLLSDSVLQVSATVLDHLTPVLAFAFESRATIRVRRERLMALGLSAGPWLTELKDAVSRAEPDVLVELPGGGRRSAAELSEDLLLVEPGQKLVYATDLADTDGNRSALQALADGAHTLLCEATFCEAEEDQARRTGHLTARACGEIAVAAGVGQLIPFHFSRRYESDPMKVYREVSDACAQTLVPSV